MVDLFTYFERLPRRARFTKEQAEMLIGLGVTKRRITPENLLVQIGQQSTVIRAEPLDMADGWVVVVNWGDHEIWTYNDWFSFSTDTDFELMP